MTETFVAVGVALLATIRDVAPIVLILIGFQVFVLRRPIPNLGRAIVGFVYVVIGLALFLVGLEEALFPLGKAMAEQLTAPEVIGAGSADDADWSRYVLVYAFAAAIGFSTTVAEPALIAVAMKASEVSGGGLRAWNLRIAVACGVAIGVAFGTLRIVNGLPLHYCIIVGYAIVIIQTAFAPRAIIPLAYDSGGVTTSTVTVPLVTALGLGLAMNIPGRSPLIDGFGLVSLASLFPMITVMGYAQIAAWWERRQAQKADEVL